MPDGTHPPEPAPESRAVGIPGFFGARPFLAAFAISFLLVSAVLLTTRIRFSLSDDVFILLMLKGVAFVMEPSETTALLNILLSRPLKNLYLRFPGIQWYTWLHVTLLFLSYGAILHSLRRGAHRAYKTLLFLLTSTATLFCLQSLQWSITASLAALGGVMPLYALWVQGDTRAARPTFTLSFLLLSLSALMRLDSFLLMGLLWLPTAAYLITQTRVTPLRTGIIRFLALTLALIGAAVLVNHTYYRSKPEWRKSLDLYHEHYDLSNYRVPYDGPGTRRLLESMGWTPNDYEMLRLWYFMDEEHHQLVNFRKLNAHFPRFRINKDPDETLGTMFRNHSIRVLGLSFVLLFFLIPPLTRSILLVHAAWVALVLVFLWIGFKIPERVVLPILLFLLYRVLFHAESRDLPVPKTEGSKTRFTWMTLLLLGILGFINARQFLSYQARFRELARIEDAFKTQAAGFTPNSDQLYVVWASGFPYEILHAFDRFEMFRGLRIVQLSWFQRMPMTQAMMARFGVRNLFRDMVDNPRMLLVCPPWGNDLYRTYMREKYGMEVVFEPVYSSFFFKVERVRSTKK